MKLYELAEDYQNFMNAVDAGEIPEEAIADTLEAINLSIDQKLDNIATIIKQLLAEAEDIREEADNLTARAKAKKERAEWLKNYTTNMMLRIGMDKFENNHHKLSFRKSEQLNVTDEFINYAMSNNADQYLVYKKPEPNKKAIKDCLKHGLSMPGAEIVTVQNLQVK